MLAASALIAFLGVRFAAQCLHCRVFLHGYIERSPQSALLCLPATEHMPCPACPDGIAEEVDVVLWEAKAHDPAVPQGKVLARVGGAVPYCSMHVCGLCVSESCVNVTALPLMPPLEQPKLVEQSCPRPLCAANRLLACYACSG